MFPGQGLSEREHWLTLETAWMRGVLARRRCLLVFEASSNILLRRFRWYIMLPHRWFRWYRAIVATLRIRRLSLTSRQNDPIYRLGWVAPLRPAAAPGASPRLGPPGRRGRALPQPSPSLPAGPVVSGGGRGARRVRIRTRNCWP